MVVYRHNHETWRDALARAAEYIGRAWEALKSYDTYVELGHSPWYAVRMVQHDFGNMEHVIA